MSKIRRGRIGIVAASGSGLQEVAVLVHQLGEGISQAIGVGGHDLSQKVGGIMFLQAMDYFASDPDTEVLVLVSKPPHPDAARKIYAALPKDKPCVVFFLGGDREEIRRAGVLLLASSRRGGADGRLPAARRGARRRRLLPARHR
ncbi:MAG: hypothetical protein ACLTSG_13300 [Lachnospiraceae bacterium]